MQGVQSQSCEVEGLTQANAVLTRSNSAVMAQLSQMTVTMNDIQAKLKTLASAQTNQARSKRKHYCWICGGNFTHGSKTCSSNKARHLDEAYYKKRMGGSEKVYE